MQFLILGWEFFVALPSLGGGLLLQKRTVGVYLAAK